MSDQNQLDSNIADSATKPKQATVDGVTVQAQDIPSQIEADKYLNAKAASKKPSQFFNLRRVKLAPPGTV